LWDFLYVMYFKETTPLSENQPQGQIFFGRVPFEHGRPQDEPIRKTRKLV